MRLVTWNINSIRARIDAVMAWVERHDPDVVLLQETKCTDAAFDTPEIGGRLTDLRLRQGHMAPHRHRVATSRPVCTETRHTTLRRDTKEPLVATSGQLYAETRRTTHP